MVDAYAHSRVVLLADVKERHKLVLNLLYFLSILLVGILQVLELTPWIDIVAWVDAHFLCIEGCHISHLCVEMDIGNKRHVAARIAQVGIDIAKVFSLAHSLSSEAHVLATSIDNALSLSHTALGVHSRRVCHRLQSYRVVSAQRSLSHMDLSGGTA